MIDYRVQTDETGTVTAVSVGEVTPVAALAVLPDGLARSFVRRGRKLRPDGGADETAWLVGELDGVRVYVDGATLVLTKQDIYP